MDKSGLLKKEEDTRNQFSLKLTPLSTNRDLMAYVLKAT